MPTQLTTDEQALRLFFTDDIYLVQETELQHVVGNQAEMLRGPETEIPLAAEPVLPAEQPALSKEEKPVFKFLGQNKRRILILVNDPENEVSDKKGGELLKKILKSVNLIVSDFALLNYAGYTGVSFDQLQSHFSSEIVLAFGVPSLHLDLEEFPENKVIEKGTVKLIFSTELRKLEEDQNAKKMLWSSLKQLGI